MNNVIGREEEKALLRQALHSEDPELIAVYGRRRIGKTFLIHNYFSKQLSFELTGTYNGSLKEQLIQFSEALRKAGQVKKFKQPLNWTEAFLLLGKHLSSNGKKGKQVIFFDEFPWLDGRKSGFLSAFEHFWNTWASRKKNIIVVICGSAASWMIRNIVNNKGGLHNRVTQRIRLLPFTLAETEAYLKSRQIRLDRYQLLQIYMAFGGVPQYLKNVKKGESSTQVIEKACFSKDGFLLREFNNLYNSLFERADNHIRTIKALAAKKGGLTRRQIIESCKLSSGGRTTLMLEELEESGFISAAVPFDRKNNDAIYRLTDEFSIFHLKFMQGSHISGKGAWSRISAGSSYKSWSGMAFEAVCLKHIISIKKAIGIEAVNTRESAWRYPGTKTKEGTQIDLLIDRADNCVNICEMKYYNTPFVIDKAYANELQRKQRVFNEETGNRKTIFVSMITTYGLKKNNYSSLIVQNNLTMDILFA